MKDLIDSLGSEEEQKKTASLKIKGGLDAIISGWKYVNSFESPFFYAAEFYSLCEQVIPCDYNLADIQNACSFLSNHETINFFNHKSGLFISALINFCNETDILLEIQQTDMNFLGYMNFKNITVNGSVGHNVGSFMESGKIIVNGNVKTALGSRMKNGHIEINGNAEHSVGFNMGNGKIVINGNAGNDLGLGMFGGIIVVNGNSGVNVGHIMRSGKIELNGNYKSISNHIFYNNKCDIYQNGKKLV